MNSKLIIIIILIICATFLLYHWKFSPFGRCIDSFTGVEQYGKIMDTKDATRHCSILMRAKL